MKRVVLAFVILFSFAYADSVRNLVDEMGNKVDVPSHPLKVASLYDMGITLTLMELGVPMVGSSSRPNLKGGANYMRGPQKLLNAEFSNTGLIDLGGASKINLEAVKASKPDLILGITKVHSKVYDKLSKIAPTFLFDHQKVELKGMSLYKRVANVVNRQKEYESLNSVYLDRLNSLKGKLSFKPEEKTAHYMIATKSDMRVFDSWGPIFQVMIDLGFKKLPIVPDGKPRISMSPENLGKMNSDFIFISYAASAKYNETPDTPLHNMDKLAPGWRGFLKAYKSKNFIVINREIAISTSFRSLHMILDDLEKRWVK